MAIRTGSPFSFGQPILEPILDPMRDVTERERAAARKEPMATIPNPPKTKRKVKRRTVRIRKVPRCPECGFKKGSLAHIGQCGSPQTRHPATGKMVDHTCYDGLRSCSCICGEWTDYRTGCKCIAPHPDCCGPGLRVVVSEQPHPKFAKPAKERHVGCFCPTSYWMEDKHYDHCHYVLARTSTSAPVVVTPVHPLDNMQPSPPQAQGWDRRFTL